MKTRIILAALLSIFLVSGVEADERSVLILNSYHEGYAWSDSLTAGIRSVLERHRLRIRIEYMDTKYLDPDAYDETLRAFYEQKYQGDQPDVIIATDISAKFFLGRHHDTLFPGVPTVLVGAHEFLATAPEGEWWTAVYPVLPVRETLDLAYALQEDIPEILVIAEQTDIGRAMVREIRSAAAQMAGVPTVAAAVDNNIERLIDEAALLPDGSAIIYTLVSQEEGGSYVPPEESLGHLVREVDVPVYAIFGIYGGLGIMGGALLEGEHLGSVAGEMALKLLEGETVTSVEPRPMGATVTICDWQQLRRFGIPESRVPPEATLINAPQTTIEIPRGIVVSGIAGGIVLAIIALVFVRLSHRQKQAQLLLESHRKQIEQSLRAESWLASLATHLNQLESREEFSDERISELLQKVFDLQDVAVLVEPEPGRDRAGIVNIIAAHFDPATEVDGTCETLPARIRRRPELEGCRSFVYASLRAENVEFGRVLYMRKDSGEWTREQRDLLSTVTSMLAVTLDRFQTSQARVDAERRNQETRALLERSARLASIGVMAAGITHEIAQPLNYIKMTTDGLLQGRQADGPEPVSVRPRKLRGISEAVDRIARVVTHMRDYWTVPSEEQEGCHDLGSALASAAALMRRQLNDAGIDLEMNLPVGPVAVKISQVSVEQILVNLVGNAMRAVRNAESPRIAVGVQVQDDEAQLEVEDNGSGLDEAELAHLFDPFYSSVGPMEGMGLGLAIVQMLVERSGGTVDAYNSELGGAGFRIRIPRERRKVTV